MWRIPSVLQVGLTVSSLACGARDHEEAAAPVPPLVVVIPTLQDETPAARPRPAAASLQTCPPGTFVQHGQCVRIVASEEIPTWKAPEGHSDPCATFTSEGPVFDCDPQNENAADAGTRPHGVSR